MAREFWEPVQLSLSIAVTAGVKDIGQSTLLLDANGWTVQVKEHLQQQYPHEGLADEARQLMPRKEKTSFLSKVSL